jgi:serine/threonine-protein kinase
VYACGILMFEMLTGSKPYTGDSPMQVIYQHISMDVPPPSTLVPGLAPQLDAITTAAASRDANRRPADAVALLAALQHIRRGLAPDQLDAEPGLPSQSYQQHPQVERTSIMRELPPDLVMPRRTPPEERYAPLPSRAARRPQRRRRWVVPAAVLLVIGLVAGGATWALDGLYMQMPSVLGETQGQAVQTLQADGLTVAITQDFSSTVGSGKVISSNPGVGTRIRKDGSVTLDVSKGPNRPPVPDVTGKSQSAAEQAIKAAGLAVGQVTQQPSDTIAQGDVISTDPAVGTKEQPNTLVNLVVSSGSQPVQLPNVVGESQDQATADLQNAGFSVQIDSNQVFSDNAAAGEVAAQSPNGDTASKGTTVTLTLSKGQQQTTVPDVTGLSEKDAKKALEGAGFQVQAVKLNPFGTPTVHNQSPAGNQQAAMGTKVTIWLY